MPAPAIDVTPSKATRRDWVALAVIALPCVLYAMDLTVLDLALPAISESLSPTSAQLLWIVDIYGFVVASALIPMGTLGDKIGRRRVLLAGAATFGAASVLAAFARSAEMLIATRALLGLAGATLAPSTLSLIRNMFHDQQERTTAIGVWVSSYSAGAAIGPLVGGVLLEHFWWGSVFLIGVPVMVLLLVAGPRLLPEFRAPDRRRLDIVSAALSLVSVLLVVYAVKQVAQAGISVDAAGAMVVGVLSALAFVRRQRSLDDPLIDLHLFTDRTFSASLALYALGTFVIFGIFVFIAQYLQLVIGLSPIRAGIATVPFALAFIVGSMVTPLIVRRVEHTFVIGIGLVIAAVGFAALAAVTAASGVAFLIGAFVVFSLGLAPVFTLATDLIVGAAPPDKAGAAAAISETASELGGALGIAILGSVGMVRYRAGMVGAGLALSPRLANMARDTLGGAVAVARQLPHDAASALLHMSSWAFVDAMKIAALVNVALVIIGAGVALFVLGARPRAV